VTAPAGGAGAATDLSALVSARLCHDLISPMGAIGNGLELMQLAQPAASAELDLVAGSLGSALAKLRFYRLAFGPADAQARQSVEEARAVTDAMFQGRFSVAWDLAAPDLTRDATKLVLLALLCLEKSLPMGGAARVEGTADAIALAVEARRLAPPPELWALVTDGAPAPGLRADGVQFALLREALVASGRRLEVAFEPAAARLTMTAQAPLPA
jgi:histidine phosphotransferase ChpT